MRGRLHATWSAALISALVLSGCSNSSTPPKAVAVPFKSPAVVDTSLPARYTCDGRDISPPLEWGAVPPATKELALFVLGLTRKPSTGGYSTTVEWGMAGVNPALHRLAAGTVPKGAHVALTNAGKRLSYSICPKRGQTKRYQFALYAIPPAVTVPARFVGIKLLALIANPQSADSAYAGGAFVASYSRQRRGKRG
jgi:phosphatidylethanolamine-binding protein (PEBP) family uncharacterized protein